MQLVPPSGPVSNCQHARHQPSGTRPPWLQQPKARPLRSSLTHSVVPRNAKSGQRAYLCQINQPSQLVNGLGAICLGLALSADCRQKPRRVRTSWTEPKELDPEACPEPHPPGNLVFPGGRGTACAYERQHSSKQRQLGNAKEHLATPSQAEVPKPL